MDDILGENTLKLYIVLPFFFLQVGDFAEKNSQVYYRRLQSAAQFGLLSAHRLHFTTRAAYNWVGARRYIFSPRESS